LTLIFVETKKKASQLDWFLRKKGFPATSIHGDREQAERTAALREFSSGRSPFLIATNVAARGLDISNITHVVNFEMPSNIDDYVHRIGRTGRAGKNGVSTSFISPDNINIVNPLIERLRENNLDVPSWLESMRPFKRGGSSFRGGRPNTGRGGFRFGARDFRSNNGVPSQQYSRPPPPSQQVPSFVPPPSSAPHAPYPNYNSFMPPPYMAMPYSMPPAPYGPVPPMSMYPPAPSHSTHASHVDDRRPAPSSSNSHESSSSYDDSKKRRHDDNNESRDKYRRTNEGSRTYDPDYSNDSKARSTSYDSHDKRTSHHDHHDSRHERSSDRSRSPSTSSSRGHHHHSSSSSSR